MHPSIVHRKKNGAVSNIEDPVTDYWLNSACFLNGISFVMIFDIFYLQIILDVVAFSLLLQNASLKELHTYVNC